MPANTARTVTGTHPPKNAAMGGSTIVTTSTLWVSDSSARTVGIVATGDATWQP